MITFDIYGNPQPNGVLKLSYNNFKDIFVLDFDDSKTRLTISKNYEKYLADFKKEVKIDFKNWIGGSFISTKMNPNDIDVVNIFQYTDEINKNTQVLIKFLTYGNSLENYMVDGYLMPIYPINDPRYSLTTDALEYWSEWLGHDKENRPKAVIEISFL
jgi:hypothetical protein